MHKANTSQTISSPTIGERDNRQRASQQTREVSLTSPSDASRRHRYGPSKGSSIGGWDTGGTEVNHGMPRPMRRLNHKPSIDGIRDIKFGEKAIPPRNPHRLVSGPAFYPVTTSTIIQSSGTQSKQPKPNPFKSAIRKIFGRKPRNDQQGLARRADHHKSDPGAMISGTARKVTAPTTQRSISLPIQEAPQSIPSQSTSPPALDLRSNNDFIVHSRESSLDFQIRPRRNTLPSIVLSPDDAMSLASALTGLAPRPLSVRGRKKILAPEMQGEIGFAVTSGLDSKRRSQSAGALRESTGERRLEQLKRDSQLVFRKESLKQHRMSSHSAKQLSLETCGDTFTAKESGEFHPPMVWDLPTPQDDPSQLFPFRSSVKDHAPMPTTEAVTLDERVEKIEEQMKVLDRTVSRLLRQAQRTTVLLAKSSSRRRPSRGRHSSPSSYSQASFSPEDELSFTSQKPDHLGISQGDHVQQDIPLERIEHFNSSHAAPETARTFLSSPTPTLPEYLDSPTSHTDSSSASPTIRALRASQSSIQAASTMPLISAADHCSALLSLLEREELARRRLEKQIASLQQEVRELKAQSYGQAYPTPSPDPHLGAVSRFSASDGGDDDEEADGNDEGKNADDEFYQTPTEEVRHICWPGTNSQLQLDDIDVQAPAAGEEKAECKSSPGRLTQSTMPNGGLF